MAYTSERLVVISFDAASRSFAINPDPLKLEQGNHRVYFALETRNRGDAEPAVLTHVYEDNLLQQTCCVGGCKQLREGFITNDPEAAKDSPYRYTVRIHYAGVDYGHDPSVVLEPPPPGG